jgi:sugar O-acyltransferase (sialic acid O-acetyltransferase NeuD family)
MEATTTDGLSGRPDIVMIGAGGHASVCVDVLTGQGHVVVGALSSDGSAASGFAVPVLGTTDELADVITAHPLAAWFVAIGDNAARRRWIDACTRHGAALPTAIGTTAWVSASATVGTGTLIAPHVVVNAGAMIGAGVIVNSAAVVEHDCRIGDCAHVAPGAVLGGGVQVGDGALIGLGSRVLPGVRIGRRAIIGAGAVVVDDVDDGVTMAGVPARRQ